MAASSTAKTAADPKSDSDPKSVVAETFANSMFAAKRPVTPAVTHNQNRTTQTPPTQNSTFPLPPAKTLAVDSAAPQYVTNPHAAKPEQVTVPSNQIANTARTTAVTAMTPPAVPTQTQPADSHASQPSRIAQSTAVTPTAQRNTTWQQPLPIAVSRNSHQAYYHRGVLPGTGTVPRPPQPAVCCCAKHHACYIGPASSATRSAGRCGHVPVPNGSAAPGWGHDPRLRSSARRPRHLVGCLSENGPRWPNAAQVSSPQRRDPQFEFRPVVAAVG